MFTVNAVEVQRHKIRGPVGYDVVGNPTIIDGVASGLSLSNYVRATQNKPITQVIEYNIKFTTSTLGTVRKLCGQEGGYAGVAIRANGAMDYGVAVSSTHNYAFDQCVVQANTIYTVNIIFDNGLITCKLYDEHNQLLSSQSITTSHTSEYSYPLAFGRGGGSRFFNGSIDMNSTYIKVNGQLWFYQPMETKYIVKDDKLVWADPRIYIDDNGTKTYATQHIAPVPAGYTFGTTTTPGVGYVDMRTQVFTPAPEGSIIGRDE